MANISCFELKRNIQTLTINKNKFWILFILIRHITLGIRQRVTMKKGLNFTPVLMVKN